MIEVLLWCGSDPSLLLSCVAIENSKRYDFLDQALDAHSDVCNTWFDSYEMSCLEAAYRLIEEDKKLCRKWFGKS